MHRQQLAARAALPPCFYSATFPLSLQLADFDVTLASPHFALDMRAMLC